MNVIWESLRRTVQLTSMIHFYLRRKCSESCPPHRMSEIRCIKEACPQRLRFEKPLSQVCDGKIWTGTSISCIFMPFYDSRWTLLYRHWILFTINQKSFAVDQNCLESVENIHCCARSLWWHSKQPLLLSIIGVPMCHIYVEFVRLSLNQVCSLSSANSWNFYLTKASISNLPPLSSLALTSPWHSGHRAKQAARTNHSMLE